MFFKDQQLTLDHSNKIEYAFILTHCSGKLMDHFFIED